MNKFYFNRAILNFFREKLDERNEIGGILITLEKKKEVYFPICIIPNQSRTPGDFTFDGTSQSRIYKIKEKEFPKGLVSFSLIHSHPGMPSTASFRDEIHAIRVNYSVIIGGTIRQDSIELYENQYDNMYKIRTKPIEIDLDSILRQFPNLEDKIKSFIENLIILKDLDYIEYFIASKDIFSRIRLKHNYEANELMHRTNIMFSKIDDLYQRVDTITKNISSNSRKIPKNSENLNKFDSIVDRNKIIENNLKKNKKSSIREVINNSKQLKRNDIDNLGLNDITDRFLEVYNNMGLFLKQYLDSLTENISNLFDEFQKVSQNLDSFKVDLNKKLSEYQEQFLNNLNNKMQEFNKSFNILKEIKTNYESILPSFDDADNLINQYIKKIDEWKNELLLSQEPKSQDLVAYSCNFDINEDLPLEHFTDSKILLNLKCLEKFLRVVYLDRKYKIDEKINFKHIKKIVLIPLEIKDLDHTIQINLIRKRKKNFVLVAFFKDMYEIITLVDSLNKCNLNVIHNMALIE